MKKLKRFVKTLQIRTDNIDQTTGSTYILRIHQQSEVHIKLKGCLSIIH